MSDMKKYTSEELKERRKAQSRAAYQRNKAKRIAYDHARDRVKTNARSRIRVLVARGKIARMPCNVCGEIKSQAHHDDYSKPLDVTWLCPKHHKELHMREAQ